MTAWALTLIQLAHEVEAQAGRGRLGGVEEILDGAVQWLRLGVEATGAMIVALGVALALYQFARAPARSHPDGFNRVRLTLARYLALALEFQLGADILSTAVAPSWEQIGKLGAVAVIRTGLNYFLIREMKEERERGAADEANATKSTQR